MCHYKGKIRGVPDSWVRLSTCDGISGVFYDGKEMHYVEKADNNDTHVVYKHSDLAEHNKTCGYQGTDFHNPYALAEARKARVSTTDEKVAVCNKSVEKITKRPFWTKFFARNKEIWSKRPDEQ